MILSVVYDIPELVSNKDFIVKEMNKMADEIAKAAAPGAYLADFFPWMLYIPSFLAKWKRDAEGKFKKYCDLSGDLFRQVERRIVNYFTHCCFSDSHN
jgi:hypothetical protein